MSLLMKTWWNWRPIRKKKKKKLRERRWRRSNWRNEEIHDIGNGKGISFIWGGTVSFWGTRCRMVCEGRSSCSECNSLLPFHLLIWWGKKSYYYRCPWIFFIRGVDRIESSKETLSVPSVSGMSEIAACFSSPIADDPSALLSPTFLSFLQSVTLFLCSLYTSCCTCTTVLFKVLQCKI